MYGYWMLFIITKNSIKRKERMEWRMQEDCHKDGKRITLEVKEKS